MNIRRIVPDLAASDFETCREFYSGLLGLRVAMDLGWVMTFVSPSNPTAQITMISRDRTAAVNPQVSIEVEDVDALYEAAIEAGGTIVYPITDEAWGVRRFFLKDPNGVVLNLMSHRGPDHDEP